MNPDLYSKWTNLVGKALSSYSSLSIDERVWFNVQVLIDSINNGGLISYYYNTGADCVYDLIEDLKVINMNIVAEIIIKFNLTLFPNMDVPSDINGRNEIIDNLDEWLNEKIQTLEDKISEKMPELENQLTNFLQTKG